MFSFITYRSCRHLDGKHTVFGKIVGGIDTLTAIERIEVDNRDRPIEDVILIGAQVFVDPYQEADEQVSLYFSPFIGFSIKSLFGLACKRT